MTNKYTSVAGWFGAVVMAASAAMDAHVSLMIVGAVMLVLSLTIDLMPKRVVGWLRANWLNGINFVAIMILMGLVGMTVHAILHSVMGAAVWWITGLALLSGAGVVALFCWLIDAIAFASTHSEDDPRH